MLAVLGGYYVAVVVVDSPWGNLLSYHLIINIVSLINVKREAGIPI